LISVAGVYADDLEKVGRCCTHALKFEGVMKLCTKGKVSMIKQQ
jgi:hypothetical protein